jgi:starch synthase (maltosyl-transferring)
MTRQNLRDTAIDPGDEGRKRTVIEDIEPEIDGGRYPIKRTIGDRVVVEADVFADGHDALGCALLHRKEDATEWTEVSMNPLGNDRWRGEFPLAEIGRYSYTVEAWVDRFRTWRSDLIKRVRAGKATLVDYQIGALIIEDAAARASADDARQLRDWAASLRAGSTEPLELSELALDDEKALLISRHPDRRLSRRYPVELQVVVDRPKARFSTWYEFFPRSTSRESGRHGTLRDCESFLPYISSMGFDVVYLPPIHPIGHTARKGRNNATVAQPGDVGSPWAIGSEEGGHKSVHPDLGTIEDFRRLVAAAHKLGMEIALDVALQCSPDHPYVREHPEWFVRRPDGTIQYAENPPKKYEDIYPFNFETDSWRELWQELESIFLFWMEQGVRIFRVDNPHTKPFAFWEWVITDIKKHEPDVIFLSEAFTRPKVMARLAKLGFSQSYTYFTWRTTKYELTSYFTELTRTRLREFFRPNLWPNTPDILSEYLQNGGRPAFAARLVLAATLGASYGIYGPSYELFENTPREYGSEEYLDSEKYGIRRWAVDRPDSMKELIARVNQIRRDNPALARDSSLRFHRTDNDMLICYSKQDRDAANTIVTVVNLDPHHLQRGWIQLDLEPLGIDPERPYQAHELLSNARYHWQGPKNFVELDPRSVPAHIFRIRFKVRTERDFDYFI